MKQNIDEESQNKIEFLNGGDETLITLYKVMQLTLCHDITVSEFLCKIISLIPPAMQIPLDIHVRILYDENEYKSEDFKNCQWTYSSKIVVFGSISGILEVKSCSNEGKFLRREVTIIDTIAIEIGKYLEQKQLRLRLQETENQFCELVDGLSNWIWFPEQRKLKAFLRKQAKQKTHEYTDKKYQIEQIIESVSEGILVLDAEGKIIFANKAIKEYFHKIMGEILLIGTNIVLSDRDHIFLKPIKQIFMGTASNYITIEAIPGLYLQFCSSSNIMHEFGSTGPIIEVKNVTSFIEYNNMRKQFLSNVSHELRTPISVVIQSITNLKIFKKHLSEDIQDQLIDYILNNARLMANLIEDLLIGSKIDNSKMKFVWEYYQPQQIIQEVITQLEPKWKTKKIFIDLYTDESIELIGDVKRMAQIFRILLDNAIKYSEAKTEVRINVSNHYQGVFNPKNLEGILIQFVDYGRGIHKKDLPQLFERFYRAEDVQGIQGTGLGLSIAKELVESHKGAIFVESTYRKGSIFNVFLPYLSDTLEIKGKMKTDYQVKVKGG